SRADLGALALRYFAQRRQDTRRRQELSGLSGGLLFSFRRPGTFTQFSELDRSFHAVLALDLSSVFDREVLALGINLDGEFDVRAFYSPGQRALAELTFVSPGQGFSVLLKGKAWIT